MKLSAWVVINLLEIMGKSLWGFKPNIMRDVVQQDGAVKAFVWFVKNMPKYEKILNQWGAIRTHLLATEISILNGCSYCTYGHIYALQLHYFKDKGYLIPFSEDEILAWHSVSYTEAIDRFQQLITSSGLLSELPFLERMLELKNGSVQPNSADDQNICHLIKMFGVLNKCGINGKTRLDEAHDPINKDTMLCRKYNRVRVENSHKFFKDSSVNGIKLR
ncbi:MAG: hypothetical protein V3T17_10400 [Pseudomonadales bacterium]